ncbi:aquaporin [Micrococcus luteus]
MAYAVGHVSGGHFNPAVTLGAALAGFCRGSSLCRTGSPSSWAAWRPAACCWRSPPVVRATRLRRTAWPPTATANSRPPATRWARCS